LLSGGKELVEHIPSSQAENRKEMQVRILQLLNLRIDSFLGGFSSSKIILIDSNHPFSFSLVSTLCVRAVESFGENVVYVDGGNSIDPYTISYLSKKGKLKPSEVLSKIKVIRAFTAYQLDTIISKRLEEAICEYNPSLLVVSCITDLLFDRNIGRKEAKSMLERFLAKIEKLTHEYNLIGILTNRLKLSSTSGCAIGDILYKGVDEVLKITKRKRGIQLQMVMAKLIMQYSPVSIFQTTLDDFIRR
jgi:hypothetical protein